MSRPETVRDLRRGQILAAARTIVAENGLEALTFGELEKRLAFTRGVITYHFASKDEIVREVFASAIDEIDEAVRAEVAAGETVDEKLRAAVRANVRGFVASVEAGRILLSLWGRLSSDPEARRSNAKLYAKYRRRCAKLVAGAVEDPDAVATLLVGVVIGIATQHYFEPGAIDVEAATRVAEEMIAARFGKRRAKAS